MRKVQPGNQKVAIAYVRVSTKDQTYGPDAQRDAIDAWAVKEGVKVAESFEDKISGAKPIDARPGLMGALEALRTHHAGILLVAKRDRVARDVIITMMVERLAKARGAELVSVDGVARGDEPASEFMRTVIDGAAAYERALIRARTKAALAAKSARGEFVGKAPYGWRVAADGVRLELAPAEQTMLARTRALGAEGLSTRAIARQLAVEGHLNRVGKPFGPTEITRMQAREPLIVTCGRGHVYGVEAIGRWCCREVCGVERGRKSPERRIEQRKKGAHAEETKTEDEVQ